MKRKSDSEKEKEREREGERKRGREGERETVELVGERDLTSKSSTRTSLLCIIHFFFILLMSAYVSIREHT
jgi:hypothetical protein